MSQPDSILLTGFKCAQVLCISAYVYACTNI